MHFKQERQFLKSVCKGHILDMVDSVGWNPIQCAIVKKRYLEFKSMPMICMEIGISESQFTRTFKDICTKLASYMDHHKNSELAQIYDKYK